MVMENSELLVESLEEIPDMVASGKYVYIDVCCPV